MNFTSVDMIIDYIYECNRKYDYLENQLNSLSKNPFSSDRVTRSEIKGKLEDLSEKIMNCTQILIDSTTFHRKKLLSFLAEVLSITEHDTYLVTKVDESDDDFTLSLGFVNLAIRNIGLANYFFVNSLLEDDDKYYLVCTKSNAKIIKNAIDSCDIEDAIDMTPDKKVIWVKKKHPHLLEGINLKDKYKVFPQLQDIAYQLVNLKLSNPEMSDEERLDSVLESLKDKYIK